MGYGYSTVVEREEYAKAVPAGEIGNPVASSGWFTDLNISAPDTALPGATVLVRTVMKCHVLGGADIWTRVVVDGYVVLDKAQHYDYLELKYSDYALTMPDRSVSISAENFIMYQGNWHTDITATDKVNLREPRPGDRYWLTVAEGVTADALAADCQDKYVHGGFRVVIEVLGAPSWVLKSSGWFVESCFWQLKAVGVDIVDYKVRGNTLYLEFFEGPRIAHLLPIIAIVAVALVVLGIWVVKPIVVQLLIDVGLAIDLQNTKTKADADARMYQYNLDVIREGHPELAIPPDVMGTISVAMWESGYALVPDEAAGDGGINWEKYVKIGVVGAVAIAAVYFLAPTVKQLIGGK